MNGNAVGLLVAAGILMMLAGVLFVFLQMWRYTAMLLIGALGCFVAALNFRNRCGNQNHEQIRCTLDIYTRT